MTVVVGVDGAGRTHRLGEIAESAKVPVTRLDAAEPAAELASLLAAARADGALVVVDDADRLPDATLDVLARAARQGVAMVIARRPTISSPRLAELDRAVAAHGRVELLEPLDVARTGALVARAAGRPASPDDVRRVHEASCGLPALVLAVASEPGGSVPPSLVARVQQRLAVLEPAAAELARVLALRLGLADDVLAQAAGIEPALLVPSMRALRDAGLLAPDGDRLIPAVAGAVLTELPPAGRRRLHDSVAKAMLEANTDPITAAEQLIAAKARTPVAAQVYADAAERLRFADPAAAARWYLHALEAGAEPAMLAAGRAEVAALLGEPVPLDSLPTSEDAARFALLIGADAAHQGRAGRSADTLLGAGRPGPVLAVPALVATGRLDEARAAAAGDAPLSLRLLADAALELSDPVVALPRLIEAAEAAEQATPAVVLPDTPHALGALAAVTAGDADIAIHLLDRALSTGVGGPAAGDRLRLLRAWARMRTGRYDDASHELSRWAGVWLPGRERLLVAALSAGLARRTGDIARLRAAWAMAEPALARQAVDLLHTEVLEELLVAAARLRGQRYVSTVLDALDDIVGKLGRPAAWAVAIGWIRLQVAVAVEDHAAAAEAARAIADAGGRTERQLAQRAAAERWSSSLAGEVDADAVLAAAESLAVAQLPWEASRLAGHAAIRTRDAAAARRLLECARELANPDRASGDGGSSGAQAGLSDREAEVARLVVEGRTYREIGAQLYLSPKTVEHHVARIRTKLGATSRAELLAALRNVLTDHSEQRP